MIAGENEFAPRIVLQTSDTSEKFGTERPRRSVLGAGSEVLPCPSYLVHSQAEYLSSLARDSKFAPRSAVRISSSIVYGSEVLAVWSESVKP